MVQQTPAQTRAAGNGGRPPAGYLTSVAPWRMVARNWPPNVPAPQGDFAMSRRRHALKLAFLTAALGVVALCLVALACAPAAPGGQALGQVEPDATAEPTATATTAATNTPATEPSATAEATSMATPETTPTATGAPFILRREITSGFLRDSFDRYQSAQSSGAVGASGSAGQDAAKHPDTALVVINTDRIDELVAFLAGEGH